MADFHVTKDPAVFVNIELWVKGTIKPMEAALKIAKGLYTMEEDGCEITTINFARGIAGTPVADDEDGEIE